MDISDLPFIPENEIENKLVEAQDKKISEGEFLDFIYEQKLFFPSLSPVGADLSGFQPYGFGKKGQGFVAAYTSLSRLKALMGECDNTPSDLALAKYCLEIGVKDFIFRIPPTSGIVVNKEYEYRFLWNSKTIKNIKKDLARRGEVPSKENVNAREIEL